MECFFFSSRRRHTRFDCDWSSDVCSSDLTPRTIPLGINIVKTNRGIDAPPDPDEVILDDYVQSVRLLKDHGDYLCLNLSCPRSEERRVGKEGKVRELPGHSKKKEQVMM